MLDGGYTKGTPPPPPIWGFRVSGFGFRVSENPVGYVEPSTLIKPNPLKPSTLPGKLQKP